MAAGCVPEHAAGLGEPLGRESDDRPAKGCARDGVEVVEADHAFGGHTVGPGPQLEFRTSPRRILVRAATTTVPTRSATGSRVDTSTGLSPPEMLANQISPRFI